MFLLLPLRARKSDNYHYCDIWKSDQENNLRTDTINEANKIKSNNFTRDNREKSNIAIAILEK